MAVTRKPDAKYWIPTENEWYKAAYHKNDGVTGNYWDYPTGSNSVPSNDLIDPDPGNNANFNTERLHDWQSVLQDGGGRRSRTRTAPTGRSTRAAMSGNGTRTVDGSSRGLRGGDWYDDSSGLQAARSSGTPTYEYHDLGFRVASVPEPGSITLLLCGAIAGLLWWKRRKS